MNNRRRFERHPIQVPVSVSTKVRRNRAGMIRDVSASGVLFHSGSKFALGERVTVMFTLAHRQALSAGLVVRTDTDDHPHHVFRFVTAVQFDAPLLDLGL